MRPCAYRNCDADLDQLPQRPKSTAKYCSAAHRVAEHRAAKDQGAQSAAEQRFWLGIHNIVRRPSSRPERS